MPGASGKQGHNTLVIAVCGHGYGPCRCVLSLAPRWSLCGSFVDRRSTHQVEASICLIAPANGACLRGMRHPRGMDGSVHAAICELSSAIPCVLNQGSQVRHGSVPDRYHSAPPMMGAPPPKRRRLALLTVALTIAPAADGFAAGGLASKPALGLSSSALVSAKQRTAWHGRGAPSVDHLGSNSSPGCTRSSTAARLTALLTTDGDGADGWSSFSKVFTT